LDSSEFEIWKMLDSAKLRSDSRNHTVPVRSVLFFAPDFTAVGFTPQASDLRVFVIMDSFGTLTDPHQDHVYPIIRSSEEYFDMAIQVAEGVQFMHEQGLAHRDLWHRNVLFNEQAGNRRWFFIDFQYSIHFPKPWLVPPLAEGDGGMFEPEAWDRSTSRYNPFHADVFCLGEILQGVYYHRSNAPIQAESESLASLWELMSERDPTKRPMIEHVKRVLVSAKPRRPFAFPAKFRIALIVIPIFALAYMYRHFK